MIRAWEHQSEVLPSWGMSWSVYPGPGMGLHVIARVSQSVGLRVLDTTQNGCFRSCSLPVPLWFLPAKPLPSSTWLWTGPEPSLMLSAPLAHLPRVSAYSSLTQSLRQSLPSLNFHSMWDYLYFLKFCYKTYFHPTLFYINFLLEYLWRGVIGYENVGPRKLDNKHLLPKGCMG